MGIFDFFRRAPEPSRPEILTKSPGFSVTAFVSNNPFTNLIQEESNYFDQYILYVSKCIDYNSSKVASAAIGLYDKDEQEQVDNELWEDFQAFNPHMNLWEARKLKEMHLMLTGAAAWYIDRKPITPGRKAEFYPLDPTQLKVKTNDSGLPAYYQYTDANGKMVPLAINDVIYFRRMNPHNWFEGLSPLQTMQFWTNAYAQGARYNMNKLGNNINIDKFVYFEGIGEDTRERLEAQLANKYGGAQNAGRLPVVNTEPKVVEVSSSQKDLDYVAGMKMLREDIMVAFGIPESLFFPSATKSNSNEAIRTYQRDTLEPLMQQEKAVLNEQLVPKYGSVKAKKGNVYFDFKSVVEADMVAVTAQVVSQWTSGLVTKDEARKDIGKEPIGGEEGKAFYTASPNEDDLKKEDKPGEDEEKKSLLAKAAKLEELLREQENREFDAKNAQMADDQEGIMYASAETLFQTQLQNTTKYLVSAEEPKVREAFNYKQAVEETKQIFKTSYEKVMSNSNSEANSEVKQKFYNRNSTHALNYKGKALSPEALNEIDKKLTYFAEEISDTTAKKLRKILAEGIAEGIDKQTLISRVTFLFNGFVDGDKNIETLSKHGFYIEGMVVAEDGSVSATPGNRYVRMLDMIAEAQTKGEITKGEMQEALRALKGLIDPSDPIGKEVDRLLKDVYHVNVKKDISYSRAITIARTESTFARNLGFNDTYTNNPFIKGKTWRSANQPSVTRDSHLKADGQTVAMNEAFKLAGGELRFPGDTLLGAGAEEIVNCRCRITAEVID